MRFDVNIIIENYRKIVAGVFVILIALTLAGIVTNIVAIGMERNLKIKNVDDSMAQVSSSFLRSERNLDYYSSIVERNIFDSQNRQPSDEKKESSGSGGKAKPVYDGPPVKSSMNATLVGTMVFSDPSYSFAKIVKGSGGSGGSEDTASYYITDSLFGEATVKKIERNRVYIERDGRTEYLEIEGARGTVMPSSSSRRASVPYPSSPSDSSEPPTPNFSSDDVKSIGGNKFLLNRKMLDGLLSNYNAVLTQARAVPNFEDGKTNGFKIFSIRDNSIYSAIGIKNGDVLSRVNGQDINNLERVLSLFTQLRNESNISIDLVRGGQKMTYEYEIR